MDANKYLINMKRLCEAQEDCNSCPLKGVHCMYALERLKTKKEMNKCIEIVENWSNEHPVKTRQSELLKIFPHANKWMCPKDVDKLFKCPSQYCDKCKKDYWLSEIIDNK